METAENQNIVPKEEPIAANRTDENIVVENQNTNDNTNKDNTNTDIKSSESQKINEENIKSTTINTEKVIATVVDEISSDSKNLQDVAVMLPTPAELCTLLQNVNKNYKKYIAKNGSKNIDLLLEQAYIITLLFEILPSRVKQLNIKEKLHRAGDFYGDLSHEVNGLLDDSAGQAEYLLYQILPSQLDPKTNRENALKALQTQDNTLNNIFTHYNFIVNMFDSEETSAIHLYGVEYKKYVISISKAKKYPKDHLQKIITSTVENIKLALNKQKGSLGYSKNVFSTENLPEPDPLNIISNSITKSEETATVIGTHYPFREVSYLETRLNDPSKEASSDNSVENEIEESEDYDNEETEAQNHIFNETKNTHESITVFNSVFDNFTLPLQKERRTLYDAIEADENPSQVATTSSKINATNYFICTETLSPLKDEITNSALDSIKTVISLLLSQLNSTVACQFTQGSENDLEIIYMIVTMLRAITTNRTDGPLAAANLFGSPSAKERVDARMLGKNNYFIGASGALNSSQTTQANANSLNLPAIAEDTISSTQKNALLLLLLVSKIIPAAVMKSLMYPIQQVKDNNADSIISEILITDANEIRSQLRALIPKFNITEEELLSVFLLFLSEKSLAISTTPQRAIHRNEMFSCLRSELWEDLSKIFINKEKIDAYNFSVMLGMSVKYFKPTSDCSISVDLTTLIEIWRRTTCTLSCIICAIPELMNIVLPDSSVIYSLLDLPQKQSNAMVAMISLPNKPSRRIWNASFGIANLTWILKALTVIYPITHSLASKFNGSICSENQLDISQFPEETICPSTSLTHVVYMIAPILPEIMHLVMLCSNVDCAQPGQLQIYESGEALLKQIKSEILTKPDQLKKKMASPYKSHLANVLDYILKIEKKKNLNSPDADAFEPQFDVILSQMVTKEIIIKDNLLIHMKTTISTSSGNGWFKPFMMPILNSVVPDIIFPIECFQSLFDVMDNKENDVSKTSEINSLNLEINDNLAVEDFTPPSTEPPVLKLLNSYFGRTPLILGELISKKNNNNNTNSNSINTVKSEYTNLINTILENKLALSVIGAIMGQLTAYSQFLERQYNTMIAYLKTIQNYQNPSASMNQDGNANRNQNFNETDEDEDMIKNVSFICGVAAEYESHILRTLVDKNMIVKNYLTFVENCSSLIAVLYTSVSSMLMQTATENNKYKIKKIIENSMKQSVSKIIYSITLVGELCSTRHLCPIASTIMSAAVKECFIGDIAPVSVAPENKNKNKYLWSGMIPDHNYQTDSSISGHTFVSSFKLMYKRILSFIISNSITVITGYESKNRLTTICMSGNAKAILMGFASNCLTYILKYCGLNEIYHNKRIATILLQSFLRSFTIYTVACIIGYITKPQSLSVRCSDINTACTKSINKITSRPSNGSDIEASDILSTLTLTELTKLLTFTSGSLCMPRTVGQLKLLLQEIVAKIHCNEVNLNTWNMPSAINNMQDDLPISYESFSQIKEIIVSALSEYLTTKNLNNKTSDEISEPIINGLVIEERRALVKLLIERHNAHSTELFGPNSSEYAINIIKFLTECAINTPVKYSPEMMKISKEKNPRYDDILSSYRNCGIILGEMGVTDICHNVITENLVMWKRNPIDWIYASDERERLINIKKAEKEKTKNNPKQFTDEQTISQSTTQIEEEESSTAPKLHIISDNDTTSSENLNEQQVIPTEEIPDVIDEEEKGDKIEENNNGILYNVDIKVDQNNNEMVITGNENILFDTTASNNNENIISGDADIENKQFLNEKDKEIDIQTNTDITSNYNNEPFNQESNNNNSLVNSENHTDYNNNSIDQNEISNDLEKQNEIKVEENNINNNANNTNDNTNNSNNNFDDIAQDVIIPTNIDFEDNIDKDEF